MKIPMRQSSTGLSLTMCRKSEEMRDAAKGPGRKLFRPSPYLAKVAVELFTSFMV